MNYKISLFLLLFPFLATSQCNQFSYYFTSDSELEEFIEMNPECKTISNITIAGPDITNLALLSHFDTIEHLSLTNNPTISNLEFLQTVEVPQGISLRNLDNLSSLSKFAEEQPLGLHISNCNSLGAIELTEEHYNFLTFQTFNLIVTVTHDINIGHLLLSNDIVFNSFANVQAHQLNLHNATDYKSFVDITNDFNLDTLTTLQIAGFQETFSSEGFPDSMVCRNFEIGSFNNLDVSGFVNKNAFFQSFKLYNIPNLKDLSSFDNMVTKEVVQIQRMDSLESIDGIPISEYIDNIIIINNPKLYDIKDINRVDAINFITIKDNPMLEVCNIDPICALISLPFSANRTKISGNKTTCYDLPSVTESCMMRDPIECSASFISTTLYDYNQVELAFELMIPEPTEESCTENQKTITIHLDGADRKEIYNGTITPSNTDVTQLNVQISNSDLLNEDFDCVDIAVQGQCNDENCYFYICQILNREDLSESTELSIYPNPAFGNITIASDIDYETHIIDINGQAAKSITIKTGDNLISIDELPSGVYFIHDGRQSYKKLIVY